ncbi:CPBP family glutamic-type intramembrane protease [Pedobacter sp.]
MYQNANVKPENSPFLQMLFLLLFAFGGVILFMVIGLAIVYLKSGLKGVSAVTTNDLRFISEFKIVLVAQQLGLFLAPAVLLSVIERKSVNGFYGLQAPKPGLLILVAILSICWMPVMGLAMEWNQKMVFPQFLKGLENWMRFLEDAGAKTTEAILKMKNAGDLIVNLFVIAVTPAICEEFIFRGAVQRTIFRIKTNPHIAIWISAIIFSAIHLQFFGFIPRLLLGAAFGYVYYWTGSIWYAVFAHFLNNAYAVCVAYYLQMHNQPYTDVDDVNLPFYGYIISAVLTLALFRLVQRVSLAKQQTAIDNN